MNIPELKQGMALVLAGPQGCGKTRLARNIAALYGIAQECGVSQLNSSRELNSLLLGRPAVLIVDGLPTRPDQWPEVKKLLTGRKTPITSGSRVAVVANPHLIFCTNESVPQPLRESRYFKVIDMQARVMA